MEAMRNRLLAQQLGLSSPADKGGNDTRASPGPSTPGGRSARPDSRVRMMPSTPGTPGGPSTPGSPATPMSTRKMLWNSPTPSRSFPGSPRRTPLGAGRPASTPNQRSGLGTPTTGSPSDRVSVAERDRQLQMMLSGIVHVHGDVDMTKARVAGLECLLLPHQVQGVEWMKQREQGEHKAGILADDMGLGKTVQMLALMQQHRNAESWRTSREMSRAAEQSKHTTAPATPAGSRVTASKKAEQRARETTSPSPVQHSLAADLRNKNPELATPAEQATDNPRAASSTAGKQTPLRLPTLIVAPLAVIQQWENEAREKTGGRLKVYVHHGAQRSRSAAVLQQADLVVTTYATASSEHEALLRAMRQAAKGGTDSDDDHPEVITVSDSDSSESERDSPLRTKSSIRQSLRSAGKVAARAQAPSYPLFQVDWLRVALDEAQNIKNHRAKTSQACFALGRRALARWCLTGTPLQNNALELFSLIHFLGVPPFNDLAHYKEKIDEPLKSTSQTRVNWGIKRLSVVLQSIMLRRTKDTTVGGRRVLELPERKVEVVSSDFCSAQERAFYRALEERIRSNLQESEQAGDTPVSFMGVLVMLLRLRQACNHPALVFGRQQRAERSPAAPDDVDQSVSKAPGDEDELADMLATLSVDRRSCERCQAALPPQESGGPILCSACERAMEEERQQGVDWTAPGRLSTKLQTVLGLLEQFRASAKDDKTLLFSQFTSFLDLLEPVLNSRGWTFVRYDGSMRRDARETALRRVRTDDTVRIILVSFRAGSTGLNLTCCNRVILTDLWWNPQIEEQAFDRAHRLGQTKPVYIYKLSINDTVEQRILDLQEKKRALAKAALEGAKLTKRSNRLTQAELSFLFHGGEYADASSDEPAPV